MTLTVRKSILIVLFAAMLVDSFYARRGSTPGYEGALFLAWAIFARLFLPSPSYKLFWFSVVCTTACLASNHGLISAIALLHSFYFYLICGVLIAWWEKFAGFFRPHHD